MNQKKVDLSKYESKNGNNIARSTNLQAQKTKVYDTKASRDSRKYNDDKRVATKQKIYDTKAADKAIPTAKILAGKQKGDDKLNASFDERVKNPAKEGIKDTKAYSSARKSGNVSTTVTGGSSKYKLTNGHSYSMESVNNKRIKNAASGHGRPSTKKGK